MVRSLFITIIGVGVTLVACSAPRNSNTPGDTTAPQSNNGANVRSTASGDTTPAAPIEETYWKVVGLRGHQVAVFDNQTEPYVQFRREGHRVAGSGGCNRLAGGYSIAGDTLRFTPLITTKMACAQGMEQEQKLLNALGAVTRYAIAGDTLRLYAGGDLMVRLEARHMR